MIYDFPEAEKQTSDFSTGLSLSSLEDTPVFIFRNNTRAHGYVVGRAGRVRRRLFLTIIIYESRV
jgi:hypothetical protein